MRKSVSFVPRNAAETESGSETKAWELCNTTELYDYDDYHQAKLAQKLWRKADFFVKNEKKESISKK